MNANPNSVEPRQPRSPWPYAIVAWFILFGSAMVVWISVAVRQNIDLVSRDYYEHEIRYQQQIDRNARTLPLGAMVKVTYEAAEQRVTVSLPAAHATHALGKITFYRPSDARLDRELKLSVNAAGEQRIDAKSLQPGLWKVRVGWTVNGEEYFFDQTMVIANPRSTAFEPLQRPEANAEASFGSPRWLQWQAANHSLPRFG